MKHACPKCGQILGRRLQDEPMYRLGRLAMAARLFLRCPDDYSRRELQRIADEELELSEDQIAARANP